MLIEPEYGHSYTKEDCYGSVGEGWHSLLDKVFELAESSPMPVYFVDCKEKWGGLRLAWYADSQRDDEFSESDWKEFSELVDEVEEESFSICEACGNPGQPRDTGWVKTMCEVCYMQGH